MKIEEKDGSFIITDFNESEAYKIASKIEEDGISFYSQVLAQTQNPQVKEKVQYLLEEEKKHLKFFQKRLYEISESKCDANDEDNLLSYMEYEVFKPFREAKDLPESIKDAKTALNIGIIAENSSINFYLALKEQVSSFETKEELAQIIEEEKRHREIFERLLSEL
jgi:rubrerythrin